MNKLIHQHQGSEYTLASDLVILSTSDLAGNILDFNEGFQVASGYTKEELQGKPHSLLRHPDMPKEAFADLWATIKDGRPWFGFVKNQRKNGQYYWVVANASPILEKGKITGYVSVRMPATAEQKAFAETLYRDVRSGKAQLPATPKFTVQTKRTWTASALVGLAVVSPLFSLALPTWGAGVVAALGLAGLAYLYRQHIQFLPTPEVIAGMEGLMRGEFETPIAGRGLWVDWLNLIRTRNGQNAAMAFDDARKTLFLNTALETASTNIMVADAEFNIMSMNRSLIETFTRREKEIQSQLPAFKADQVIGSNMDIFHKNPAHQRAMLGKLTSKWQGVISVGGLKFRLTATPIMQGKECIGYVVEWLDVSVQDRVETNLSVAMDRFARGHLDSRIDTTGIDGFLLELSIKLNRSMDGFAVAMDELLHGVRLQSEGDLTYRIQASYEGGLEELKEAINTTGEKLNHTVAEILSVSKAVAGASSEVSSGSMNLSHRTQEMAASLEETAASMEEMTATVKQNTDSANQANQLASQARNQAGEGGKIAEQAVHAMQTITDSSRKIADIITLIDGIAFQTNLLALNAAVEAARAGEHGRGFAVVAGEVRSLAQKSAEASRDIKTLIESSVANVEHGSTFVAQTGEALESINGAVKKVSDIVSEIAAASAEQAQGIDQVNRAVMGLDSVTQQNAALVEETSAAAGSLSNQSSHLKDLMDFFKADNSNHEVGTIRMSDKTGKSSVKKVEATPKRTEAVKKPKAKDGDDWSEF